MIVNTVVQKKTRLAYHNWAMQSQKAASTHL